MRLSNVIKLMLLLMATTSLVMACRSLTTGNLGNLQFSYIADDTWLDFNKPIAAGAKLELRVQKSGSGRTAEVTSAKSADESVLKVVSFSGDRIIVEGVADGNVLLEVTARTDGEELPDEVNLNVRTPDQLILTHTCEPNAQEGLWLTSNQIYFQYEMKQNDRNVIGYGFHPVTFTPAVMTPDLTTKDQQWMHLTMPAQPQTVTMASTVDSESKTLRIVSPSQIDGAKVQAAFLEAWVGSTVAIYLLPTVADKPVCQAQTDLEVVETNTPDICTVTRPASASANGPKNEWGWVRVEGKKVGVCEFTVNYTAGNGGQGARTKLSVDVNEVVQPTK